MLSLIKSAFFINANSIDLYSPVEYLYKLFTLLTINGEILYEFSLVH